MPEVLALGLARSSPVAPAPDMVTVLNVDASATFCPAFRTGPVDNIVRKSVPTTSHSPEVTPQLASGSESGGNDTTPLTT